MKKIFLILAAMLSLMCVSCKATEPAQSETIAIKPQETQMRNICELATFDCYYHNVAKYYEKDATGALLWKKDRKFWIEYSGIVTIGIDVSKVKFNISDDTVSITLPPAQVQSCKVDETTLTDESFIIDAESAVVEAEHQTAAFKEAQENMKKAAANDNVLLENARSRAKQLLEGYVNNIGNLVGKKYTIVWECLDSEQPTTSEVSSPAST